jgi:acyl-coenzyme A synthetase/AMP-(fatty) acid ligase
LDQKVVLGDPAMIIYTSGTTGPPKVNRRVEVQERSKERKWIRRWCWEILP